jgi:hypothetical protein
MVAAKKTKQPEPGGTAVPIFIERLSQHTMDVKIVGTAPLIPHQWAEKSIRQMREKQFQTEKLKPRREAKNPEEEAHAATYWCEDGRPGMPATAFKAAMVGACRLFESLPMVQAKVLFYVEAGDPGGLVPIDCERIKMREDLPRNANGSVDLRYRNQLEKWSATLTIRYVASRISQASILALVDAAGTGGVGDWRPSAPKSATGFFGTWELFEGD